MPMSHDQPDNAARIERLGVGRSLPPRKFTAQNVARRLDELLKAKEVPVHCREVAGKFQGADPLADACRLIETAIDGRTG
jgi:UDP:flavonoid glycosyltransferase YjiC (YdhE family)